jgi:hypothetical protein
MITNTKSDEIDDVTNIISDISTIRDNYNNKIRLVEAHRNTFASAIKFYFG